MLVFMTIRGVLPWASGDLQHLCWLFSLVLNGRAISHKILNGHGFVSNGRCKLSKKAIAVILGR